MIVMGRTPEIYERIGLNQLPMTITGNHVYSIAKTQSEATRDYNGKPLKMNYHGVGEQAVKQLLNKVSDPIMVLAHQEFTPEQREKHSLEHKIISIVEVKTDEKSVIIPIEIDAEVRSGKNSIDSNNVASYFEKKNVASLIQEAIAKENIGETGFYFIDKKRATAILKRSGHQLPSTLMTDNSNVIIRNISENVKKKIANTTQSMQFKRWFGDWQNNPKKASKIVNEDGTPKVVYHGTSEKFTVFDRTKGRSNMDIQGMFFSPWEIDAKGYGENVGEYYLSIKNPAPEGVGYKALRVFAGQNNAGIKAREYLEKLGYDGVNNSDEEYIAFYSNQIKSATDNIGTFDPENDDTHYAVSDDETGGKRSRTRSAA